MLMFHFFLNPFKRKLIRHIRDHHSCSISSVFSTVPRSFFTDTNIVYFGCVILHVCVVLRKAQADRCQVQVCPPPWLAEQGRGAEQAGGREGIDRVRGKEGLAVSQTDLLIL